MEIVTSIAGKIGEYLVVPIGKQVGYLIYYNSNIETFKDQLSQKLADKRNDLQLQVDVEKRNGQVILSEVESWLTNSNKLNEGLRRFLEEDVEANSTRINGWCPNLKLRYSLSRKAKKKTKAIVELLRNGKFDRVSNPAPPLGIVSSSIEGFKVFESRTLIMREVLEALRDDKIKMIALCGMGGIGKTTMVKEVAKRVKDENLFDEVTIAMVSQNPNVKKIQGELADMLGLEFQKETAKSLPRRARQLYLRIMNGKRILIILDDVWEGLNLEDVGIPHGDEQKCKILLTSRKQEACSEMRTQKLFSIKILFEEESWDLFREMAGNSIDSPDLRPIAEKVAKECRGLPVAIVTVGRALEDKNKDEWIAALQQLEKSIPENIHGLHSKVYSSIELSYSHLKSNEAKSCFLLCCLFPEDYDIPIEYLVIYGVGQRLFAKIDTVAEARIRVHALVQNLRRSFLLIDSKKKECVKMHDVVRDVAIEIASKGEHGVLVRCDDKMEEWPKEYVYERCAAISLVFKDLKKYPDGLECPKLELLHLSYNNTDDIMIFFREVKLQTTKFPANFFEGMNILKVLTLRDMSFESLPSSIQALQNLRTLNLDYCILGDVSAIGALEKLEILSFFGSEIAELPREIGHLKHLRLLDLGQCGNLKRIPRGILSGLSQLEELYMRNSFEDWESMEEKQVGTNASLAELLPVSHRLTALDIHVRNANKVWPKDLFFKNQMIRFKISSTTSTHDMESKMYLFQNSLELNSDASDIMNCSALHQLLEKSDFLKLEDMKNLRNILYELDQKGFPHLKVLSIDRCDDVEYLVDATSEMTQQATFPLLESLLLISSYKLKEIYHSQLPKLYLQNGQPSQLASFGNLRSIELYLCIHLKNVFSLSIARGLIQLQHISILSCYEMEEILSKEREENEKVGDMLNLPQLTSLELRGLPNIIGFCKAINAVELPQSSHVKATQPSLNIQEVGFGTNELITSQMGKMTEIQQEQHRTGSFSESRSMPRKLFSSKSVQWPPNLEKLEVYACDLLEAVFDLEGLKLDEEGQAIAAVLAKLKTLKLGYLNLTHVWKNVPLGIQGFQNLTSINLYYCSKLRYLFSPSIAKLLVELQSLLIDSCNVMENIVQRGQDNGKEDARIINIVFPKVNSFLLENLPNFVSFCFNAYSFEWPSMKNLCLNKCPKLKTFGSEINIGMDSSTQEPDGFDSSPVRYFPGFLCRCLECVPHHKNFDRNVESDQGTTKKSRGSSSLKRSDQSDFHGQTPHYPVNKEVTLTMQKKPSVSKEDNQPKIWFCFPSNLIGGLQNLERFKANQCDSLEAIFQLEGQDVEESHDFKALNNLTELVLTNLSKLMHIWKKGPQEITGFQNLRFLEVCDCNSLTYLFSPAIGKLLMKLEKIKVENCQQMKQIIVKPREEEKKDVIVFTQVNSLSLQNLPQLECFYSEANAFEWPSLEVVSVVACPELKTFVLTETITPKLKGVSADTNSEMRQWEGDLNATIQHIFKGKEEEEEKKKKKKEEESLGSMSHTEPKVDPEIQPQEQTGVIQNET